VKFKSIFEDSHDAILLIDKTGSLDCNRQALAMFGFTGVDDMVRSPLPSLSPHLQPDGRPSQEKFQDYMQSAFQEGYVHFEWEFQRKGGEFFQADVVLSSFIQGKKRVIQATIRDISERKQAEAALQEINDRFLSYVRETALRLRAPIAVVEENLGQITAYIEKEEIERDQILLLIRIQEKHLAQIRQNVVDLNQRVFDEVGGAAS
jgi:PAS domain S-box-containing protein